MTGRSIPPGAVGQAAARVKAESRCLTPKKLCKRLRLMTAKLRRQYLLANEGAMRAPVEEWLCDNYYVLEKESKQAASDLRHMARRGGSEELMWAYRVLEETLRAHMPPLADETLAEILEEMNEARPLNERQFGVIPAAIKAVLIGLAFTAVTQTSDAEQIAYAITGFGKLSSLDLSSIIQKCSAVERILMEDPAGVYGDMSDDSRAYYRSLVAEIAHTERLSEREAALAALREAQNENAHIGFALVRRPALVSSRRRRGVAALVCDVLLPLAASALLGFWTRSAAVGALCFLPLWEIFHIPVHQLALAGVDVDYIPRMDPAKKKDRPGTVVLVSTLLPKAAEAPALARRLEQLYFSNSDPDMYYCILADLGEWDYPVDEKDDSQIAAARRVVESLNLRYGARFMLFLRARVYNSTQKRYSGWERKRGAITEFIRFLGGEKTSLHTFAGDRQALSRIRYLIALDSDTSMLYESGQTLVCAAMHPLNRPVVGENGVVVSGYGVLAPKISTDLASAKRTAFSRIMNGCGGVTAYETRDKDFYQDLFGESIFAGKGLIDVEAFRAVLDKRLPEGRVLSHDVLEGAYLRCGFVSDVEMADGAPSAMNAWFARLHRWLRGDWQNMIFLRRRYRADGKVWENPISTLSKYKLFDNLRRSLTCVAAMLCLVAALFSPPRARLVLACAGVLAVMFPALWSVAWSLCAGGFFTVSRKFFTRTLPHTFELIGQALFLLVMLPAQALLTVDAVIRSLWRTFVSRNNLLEWTTAAQAESRAGSFRALVKRFWLAELAGVVFLLLCARSGLTLVGICFAALIPLASYSEKPTREERRALSPADRDALISYNAAMWRYYETFANEANHFLPPDNVQQSPVYRVAARTSPTNIGMYLLSILAAKDFGFIDADGLLLRLERTVTAVERLAKWHGNLYNWYDTQAANALKPEFVSTVDSGNFVCCLVALKEGLRELLPEKHEFGALLRRIETLIDATDLSVFYNKRKRLFSIGWDVPSEKLVDSHYDFLMSEARLTSYFAVARKTVGKKHWGAMGRAMSRWGSYAGPVSWTGTMFEYFMPHLLLPVYDGSLLGESLFYCLYCQKRRARAAGTPWGISESAFYAFDSNLNYQYKAHGVQKLGVKRYLDKELVISPYSTFLAIPFQPDSSMRNLHRLRELGVYGRYGFYEAVDFTRERVGTDSLAVTRSYMAHHIGMSMIASCNAVFENRMQKRFMSDHHMRSGEEFLQEKIAKSTVIYDPLENGEGREEKQELPRLKEERRDPNPLAPLAALLTNGELTEILTDVGAGWLCFGGIDLTRRDVDLLRRGQGILTVVRMDGVTLPCARVPFHDPEASYTLEQQEQCVAYFASRGRVEAGVRSLIHPTISCQQRQIVVKNRTGTKQIAEVLCYFEPVLAPYQDYSAHPAYSKLFVSASFDPESRTLTFSRRNRDGSTDLFLTVGFLQDVDFSFETSREALTAAPGGLEDLLRFPDKRFSSDAGACTPDACCAIRFDLLVSPNGQQQATLLICAARSASEGAQNIIAMRKLGNLEPKAAAKSPLLGDSLEARLGEASLGKLLFTCVDCSENRLDKSQNQLGQSALWPMGISGDFPILLLELGGRQDPAPLEGYVRLHTSLRRLGIPFDLVVLCACEEQRAECRALVQRHSAPDVLGARGGVFALLRAELPPERLALLRAVARSIAGENAPQQTRPPAPYQPALLRAVAPCTMPEEPDLAVEGGAFSDGRFFVDKFSPLPWSHVLANRQFGTLVSDNALGYTWAFNARENKLTPWHNDVAADNTGEMAILHDGESYYSLTRGARASFGEDDARWHGKTEKIASEVRVTVSATGCAKYIDVRLRNRTNRAREVECAYYVEPVLGVSRDTARHICAQAAGAVLTLHNPYAAIRCWAALAAEGGDGDARKTVDRAAFLSGDWQSLAIEPSNDPCAALILPVKLAAGESRDLRFVLACAAEQGSAVRMATLPPSIQKPQCGRIQIDTPDPALNQFINHFAPHQILAGRIQGRCAFYQCGGAFGFRDQLQDVCAYLLLDPDVARRQILRCCAVQFEEGDALHWWHPLPRSAGGIKGVRTRFSDDLLWLPLAVSDYVEKTGDKRILDVCVRYLKAEELAPGVQERYLSPERSEKSETVFAHCVKALERGFRIGENGLPLIGCGDWNDGFSSVGPQGRGTSVWLAMFLSMVLTRFAEICTLRAEEALADLCRQRAQNLRLAVDEHCWDGGWYVRAFFDNGEAMGARQNEECQIDLLPQSFAVFSGMPETARVDAALQNAFDRLVDHKLRLVRLFDPPFHSGAQQPGYVKAYPPGVRENGGQYTHSAVWFAMALLEHGRVDDGWKILEMLNPADRALRPGLAKQYALEPYYLAADIYTNPGALGRGGWSIYTGAASWYYRAVIETLLGVQLCGTRIALSPRLPSHWSEARLELFLQGTRVRVHLSREAAPGLCCDGSPAASIPLDGAEHDVLFGIPG